MAISLTEENRLLADALSDLVAAIYTTDEGGVIHITTPMQAANKILHAREQRLKGERHGQHSHRR